MVIVNHPTSFGQSLYPILIWEIRTMDQYILNCFDWHFFVGYALCCWSTVISLLQRNNTDPRPGSRAFGQLLIEELHKRELKIDVSQKLKEARTFVQEWRHSVAKGIYIHKPPKRN